MAEGVNLPGDVWHPALPECIIEAPEAQGHLVDDADIVGHGLVIHAPAPADKLKLASRHEVSHQQLSLLLLLLPPSPEEGSLHLDEPLVRVPGQLLHHRVQRVLHPGPLGLPHPAPPVGALETKLNKALHYRHPTYISTSILKTRLVILVNCFEPTHIVVTVTHEVDI